MLKEKNMGISARYQFQNEEGEMLFITYQHEYLSILNPPVNREFEEHFLRVGEVVTINNIKYSIMNFYIIIHKQTYSVPDGVGIKTVEVGSNQPFNTTVTLIVREIPST